MDIMLEEKSDERRQDQHDEDDCNDTRDNEPTPKKMMRISFNYGGEFQVEVRVAAKYITSAHHYY